MKNGPRATEMDVSFNLLFASYAVACNLGSHDNANSNCTHGPGHEVGRIDLAVDGGNIYS
jgi:hypothetical protein